VPDEAQRRRNADFHAFGTPEQNARRLRELRAAAYQGGGNLFGFGTYLHFLQDSSTHRHFAGNTTWGQVIPGGHEVDQTSFDRKMAMATARIIFDELKEFAERRGCKCRPEPDWNVVRAFMEVGYNPADPRGIWYETSDDQLRTKIGILNVPWRSATGR